MKDLNVDPWKGDSEKDREIISFSGTRDLPEQVLSIFSYVRFCGIPKKWYLYSDGSHTVEERSWLKGKFSFIEILEWDCNYLSQYSDIIDSYSKLSPASKKIQVIAAHKYNGATVFTDSDVLFGSLFTTYFKEKTLDAKLWYMADVPIVSRIEKEGMYPFNFGFLILDQHFDSTPAFDELKNLNGNFSYFSDQDAFGNAFRAQGSKVLDPRTFVLSTEDQFSFGAKFHPSQIAVRHFVNPVRHKMWQRKWNWHLDL